MNTLEPAFVEAVRDLLDSDIYAAYLRNTLLELAAIDTGPSPDRSTRLEGERALLDFVEREIREIDDRTRCERQPIDPADASGQDRCNLVVTVPGADADSPPAFILHVHLDVLSAWHAPRSAGERVFGHGVCGDRGQLAVLLAQIKLLREIRDKHGLESPRGFAIHLVIDDEVGGQGAIRSATDSRYAQAPVLMLEPTGLVPCCAHVGVLPYRCQFSTSQESPQTALEIFPLVVTELEELGRAIRHETRDSMFPADHIRINQGILGPYGQHPGLVCDHVAVEFVVQSKANPHRVQMIMVQIMEKALGTYLQMYGDATGRIDPGTGQPALSRHFDLQIQPSTDTQNFRLDVWGKASRMGAGACCDNAIAKAAYLIDSLIHMSPNFPNVQATGTFPDSEGDDCSVILEGSLSFAPPHAVDNLQERVQRAARRGVETWCKLRNLPFESERIETTFGRPHTEPYVGAPDNRPMEALRTAFEAMGLTPPAPAAWPSRCDARIYHEHGHAVAIFGAGALEACHKDTEYIDIPDLQRELGAVILATRAMAG